MSYPVQLYIYDLSQGMARSLGPALGLHDLEGVWHTAIVVHNTEIFFGGSGIEHCLPGTTMLGQPLQTQNLGSTNIDMETLTAYLRTLGQSEFHGGRYDLFKHNCNNFSSYLTKFLGVENIPQHILDLPDKVMSSPMAAMLRPILEQATPDGQGTSFSQNSSPPTSSNSASNAPNPSIPRHFPPKEYSVINPSIDLDKVMAKLMDFNEKNSEKFNISGDYLTQIRLLNETGVKIDNTILDLLSEILSKWPNKDETFPLFNIICCNIVREGIISQDIGSKLYKMIKSNKLLTTDSPSTRMCLRILVNFFSSEPSRKVMLLYREDIIGEINTILEDSEQDISPQVESAVASLAINYAKAINDQGGDSDASFQIVSGLSTVFLGKLKGPDPLFKTVAAIATLVKLDSDVKALTEALEVKTELAKIPKGRMARLDECVTECLTLLN